MILRDIILLYQLLKNKQEGFEKLIEMSRNDDYTTGNLLDYLQHQKCYKRIGTDCMFLSASLAKWLSVRLRTKWLWVRVPLQYWYRFIKNNKYKHSSTN